MPLALTLNPDPRLRMCPDGDWAVSYTENKDHNNNVGWCYSANNGAAHPCAVTGWKVRLSVRGRRVGKKEVN